MVDFFAVGSAVDLGEVGASFEAEGIREEDIEVEDRASSFEADTVPSEDTIA